MSKANLTIAFHVLGLVTTVALALLVTFVTVGCGHSNKVSNEDLQILELQRQMAEQQSAFNALSNVITVLNNLIAQLETALNSTNADVQELADQLEIVQNSLQDILNQQVQTQLQVNSILLQLAQLQGYINIVGMVDICGDTPGKIDEVLLKLSNGQLLASFSDSSNGTNTRFSIIPPGSYVSTDGTACHFTVHSNGTVTW